MMRLLPIGGAAPGDGRGWGEGQTEAGRRLAVHVLPYADLQTAIVEQHS